MLWRRRHDDVGCAIGFADYASVYHFLYSTPQKTFKKPNGNFP